MIDKPGISVERLRDLLSYDPASGNFTWNASKGRAKAGQTAGADEYGYRAIRIDGKMYRAHRLAWLVTFGEFPSLDIDHINGDRADNRITNLRVATRSQNLANMRPRKGLKGASYSARDRRWVAWIRKDSRSYFLGGFKTAEEAHAAYCRAAHQVHGQFARTV